MFLVRCTSRIGDSIRIDNDKSDSSDSVLDEANVKRQTRHCLRPYRACNYSVSTGHLFRHVALAHSVLAARFAELIRSLAQE